ncbi:hypothetical protein M3629_17585 [Paenibacillus polysaccharolyticus]|uniref:hypothetical protein n=1 Tax=Paenibacillus polysaccharolyticus TaxID=582692 RepID=UPI00203D0D25|nr:hypothetical protein [Paenibacillus polysaccharolyticus]MCM3134605.1 hypothetical protein [Paenibacillus polysaccharolyticus]
MELLITGIISDMSLPDAARNLPLELHVKEETFYNLIVTYSIEGLLKDEQINSLYEEEAIKKRIYDLLRYQLEEINRVFCDQGIEILNSRIQGVRYLDANIVKVEIVEELEDVIPRTKTGKKSKRKPMKTFVIAPDLEFVQETASRIATKELARIYTELMEIMPNKKFMSEVLGIEPTENDELLIEAFLDQYSNLWLATGKEKDLLLEKFRHRIELVIAKRSSDKDETQ